MSLLDVFARLAAPPTDSPDGPVHGLVLPPWRLPTHGLLFGSQIPLGNNCQALHGHTYVEKVSEDVTSDDILTNSDDISTNSDDNIHRE